MPPCLKPCLQTLFNFTRLMIWGLQYWRKLTYINLECRNYYGSQDRGRDRSAQCHRGELHLIKRWEKDNYYIKRSAGDLTHVSRSVSEQKAHPSNEHICLQSQTQPSITLTSGPLPSAAGVNTVICSAMDHLWRGPSEFDTISCFQLNSQNE